MLAYQGGLDNLASLPRRESLLTIAYCRGHALLPAGVGGQPGARGDAGNVRIEGRDCLRQCYCHRETTRRA